MLTYLTANGNCIGGKRECVQRQWNRRAAALAGFNLCPATPGDPAAGPFGGERRTRSGLSGVFVRLDVGCEAGWREEYDARPSGGGRHPARPRRSSGAKRG